MPRSYPPEFHRKVFDLLKAGRKVAEIAHGLQISEQTIYVWRKQERIDADEVPGLTSVEKAALAAVRWRIAELAVHQRASELLTEEGLPIQMACRILRCPGQRWWCTQSCRARRRPGRVDA